MKYGTGAPGQAGWAVDFQEILFFRGPPPKKNLYKMPGLYEDISHNEPFRDQPT